MTADTAQAPTYTGDTYIPIWHWAKDHFSTLAYMETVMVELGHFPVCYNPRMRGNRRHTRLMIESKKAQKISPVAWRDWLDNRGPAPMPPGSGTILNTGQEVANHDDWDCVQDMANEGLLTNGKQLIAGHQIEPGVKISLSETGRAVIRALREFKAVGGNFAAFRYVPSEVAK